MTIPDACPDCPPPFDRGACLPDGNGVYRCPAGHRWTTERDAYGWPTERRTAA